MKILLLSDSHGCLRHMQQAVVRENPDMILHMGDHFKDAKKLQMEFPHIPLRAVPGNCDYVDWETPLTAVHILEDVSIMMTHGHGFGVKSGLSALFHGARERGVQVALFGHTHLPYSQRREDILLVNPGSCGAGSVWSYGILKVADGVATCDLLEMED